MAHQARSTTILFVVCKPGHSAWSEHTDLDEALAERQRADDAQQGHKVYRVIGDSVKEIRAGLPQPFSTSTACHNKTSWIPFAAVWRGRDLCAL